MQEQVDNVLREMDILRKNKREMLDVKTTVTEVKKAFDGFTAG